jgi:hypothetical protein
VNTRHGSATNMLDVGCVCAQYRTQPASLLFELTPPTEIMWDKVVLPFREPE